MMIDAASIVLPAYDDVRLLQICKTGSHTGGSIDDLVDGSLVSNCPLPCKTTQTHTEFLNDLKSNETYLELDTDGVGRVGDNYLVCLSASSNLLILHVKLLFLRR